MASKARLFRDNRSLQKIMSETVPVKMKKLGGFVKSFDQKTWDENKFNIVVWANYYKFSQNHKLKEILLATGDREIVEASPRDSIWGIGFSAESAPFNRHKWGHNLLGKALMEVRQMIKEGRTPT